MKKIIVFIIIALICCNNLSYGQIVNGGFDTFSGCTVPTVGTCVSFTASCIENWKSAYGTPQVLSETNSKQVANYFGYMWSNSTGCFGEGMFAGYAFQANTTYKLSIDANATDLKGGMNILLTNGLTHLVSSYQGSCGDNHRSVTGSQNIVSAGSQTNIPTTWTTYSYSFATNNVDTQIYIYPCSGSTTQYNLDIDNLAVQFDCSGIITYNIGVIPTNKSKAGYINVGSTAGVGGSGTVTNSSTASTYLLATTTIDFVPGFHATASTGGILSAKIVDCSSILAARQAAFSSNYIRDDQSIIDGKTEQEKYADSLKSTIKKPDLKSSDYISIYPNPVNEKLNLIIRNLGGEVNVSIVDIAGRSYYSLNKFVENNSVKSMDISTSNLPKGTYFIKVSNETSSFVKQFEK